MPTRPNRWSSLERPPLEAPVLRRALRVGEAGSWWSALDVVEATGSTNADLAAAARDGAAEATVLVAEHQEAGRGRLGRGWQAPPRSALTLSVLVRPAVPAARWSWLPLLTGVAVVEVVRSVARLDANLKWPNDVLVAERKLAGVLLERVDTATGPAAVLGMGVNVSSTQDELPVPAATSLALEGAASTDRQPLLLALLRTLEALYGAWTLGTPADPGGLHASYVRRCATVGRDVRVELADGSVVTGRAETVDGDGRLVLVTEDGTQVLAAGDVVHVRPHHSRAP